MPNSKSAEKRLRQNEKRRLHNRSVKAELRTQLRKVREALAGGDVAKAEEEYRLAASYLDRAGRRRVVHPNQANRTKSRLQKHIKAAKQAPAGTQ